MSTFEQTAAAYKVQRATSPLVTIVLHREDFASDYADKPDGDVCLGIRVLSANAEDSAKTEARKRVAESDGDIETELKRQYLIQYVAQAICDANDVSECAPGFDMASEQLPAALTSNALLRIYDTAERLKVETSPLFPEATDDEAMDLAGELIAGALEDLAAKDPAKAARVRRYLRFCLDDLRG